MSERGQAYLAAAEAVVALLERPEVAQAWERPSALAGWSVGGLAAHLGGEVLSLQRVLDHPVGETEVIGVDDHYARAAWVRAGHDDDVNVGIRAGGEEEAAAGVEALRRDVAAAVVRARESLADADGERVVRIPWQPWCLTLDDFLLTRLFEIVVHSDDLAASVGIPAPPLPEEVLAPVLALLTRLAVRRYGQSAVVTALTRRERAPGSIVVF